MTYVMTMPVMCVGVNLKYTKLTPHVQYAVLKDFQDVLNILGIHMRIMPRARCMQYCICP